MELNAKMFPSLQLISHYHIQNMARLIKQSTMRMIMISTESDEMMPQLGVIPNVKPAVTVELRARGRVRY